MRILLVAAIVAAFAGDLPLKGAAAQPGLDGAQLYSFHACANCHGPRGLEPARESIPRIGGLPAGEIVSRASAVLQARPGDDTVGMNKWARELRETCNVRPTAPELERIADWLSSQE
jgi:cytochrome c553